MLHLLLLRSQFDDCSPNLPLGCIAFLEEWVRLEGIEHELVGSLVGLVAQVSLDSGLLGLEGSDHFFVFGVDELVEAMEFSLVLGYLIGLSSHVWVRDSLRFSSAVWSSMSW